jgi:hypothetical protein
MKRAPLRRRTQLRARTPCGARRNYAARAVLTPPARNAPRLRGGPASPAARTARSTHRSHGLHVIPRSPGGCEDPTCVVPLCRSCHRAYDTGWLDLLPHLEPSWRTQLAHAVGHVGLIGALRTSA